MQACFAKTAPNILGEGGGVYAVRKSEAEKIFTHGGAGDREPMGA